MKRLISTLSLLFINSYAGAEELPLPSFPESFPSSHYEGHSGCIPDDSRYQFAVQENEGLIYIGAHPIFQTPKDGVHAFIMLFHPSKKYGYVMSNKAEGSLCVSERLSDYTFKNASSHSALHNQGSFNQTECSFTPRYTDTCGTYQRLAGALLSKGFRIDFQAINKKGFIYTYLSGNGKSYRLTTHPKTGATVITGNATKEFVFHETSINK